MRFIPISFVLALGACAFKQSPSKTEVPESVLETKSEEPKSITRDYVIEGTVNANDIGSDYQKLVFRPGSRLITQGRDLNVSVDEIVSEGGVIETFPENQQAGFGKPGRSSGKIHIRARTATGSLIVISRGEAGGRGSPGLGGERGVKGVRSVKEGELRGAPYGIICARPGDGGAGGQGQNGFTGNAGLPGGEAQSILVEVQEESSFVVRPAFYPGRGGPGGEGGMGGPGGEGGDPGHLRVNSLQLPILRPAELEREVAQCQGKVGPVGPVGPQGAVGPEGTAGAAGALCGYVGALILGVGCLN